MKIASGNDGGMQQIQVLPVQSPQGGQQIIMQPNHTATGQAQAAQVIQTADGQTLIYQPVQVIWFYMNQNIVPQENRYIRRMVLLQIDKTDFLQLSGTKEK